MAKWMQMVGGIDEICPSQLQLPEMGDIFTNLNCPVILGDFSYSTVGEGPRLLGLRFGLGTQASWNLEGFPKSVTSQKKSAYLKI